MSLFMGPYGVSLGLSMGSLWVSLWIPTVLFGFSIGPYGSQWVSMGPYRVPVGSLWVSMGLIMDPYGS